MRLARPRASGPRKAIVLGCTHGGLAVVRSLARLGVDVLVLSYQPTESGLRSRYVDQWQLCPHAGDEEAFVETLLALADRWSGALLFSTNDYFATAVAKHHARLAEQFRLDVVDWEHARFFLEKDRTYALASELGIPHPRSASPGSMAELEALLPTLAMPVMIKPIHSHRFVSRFGVKLMLNHTENELRRNFERVSDAGEEVMLSELIPGSDYRTLEVAQFYIDRNGEVAASFCGTKLRQTPPMFGVMRVGQSLAPTPELTEPTLRLLRRVGYRGFASAEFKRDPRDGRLKLIEVNIRPVRFSQLAISCGVDFPAIALADTAGETIEPTVSYEVGRYYAEVSADIADFVRFDGDRRLGRLLEPYRTRRICFPYLSVRDPAPAIYEVAKRVLRAALKLLVRRPRTN